MRNTMVSDVARIYDKDAIKIAMIQLHVIPGRPDSNVDNIISIIEEQKKRHTDMVVFPEMCVGGYMIGDKWESERMVEDMMSFNEKIAKVTEGIIVIWGNVHVDAAKKNNDGSSRKYNAAWIAQNGVLLPGTIYKTNLPTYRQFHDGRHFTSAQKLTEEGEGTLEERLVPVEFSIRGINIKVGIMLCEDMWWNDYGASCNVPQILRDNGAELLLNLSCSPWGVGKNNKRHRVVSELFSPLSDRPALLYINNVGVQDIGKTVLHFDGGTSVYDTFGNVMATCVEAKEDILFVDVYKHEEHVELRLGETAPRKKTEPLSSIGEVKGALIATMRDFMKNLQLQRVVIGLSGGIDSCVSAALWCEAIGSDKVFGINMPTRFNSVTTKSAAKDLANNLGMHYTVFPIEDNFNEVVHQVENTSFINTEGVHTSCALSTLHKENIQARLRGSTVLSSIASSLEAIISCNGNKVEFAFGYSTLYGDNIGALAPLGDLSKGQVYELGREINREYGRAIIPDSSLTQVASAELSDEQSVEKGKGDPFLYPYHEALTKYFVEYLSCPEDILKLFMEEKFDKLGVTKEDLFLYFSSKESLVADLEHKWNIFHRNVFKRYQAPPVIKVSTRAFGYDFHESQVSPYFSSAYYAMKECYLKG